jgi:hypothetical protein
VEKAPFHSKATVETFLILSEVVVTFASLPSQKEHVDTLSRQLVDAVTPIVERVLLNVLTKRSPPPAVASPWSSPCLADLDHSLVICAMNDLYMACGKLNELFTVAEQQRRTGSLQCDRLLRTAVQCSKDAVNHVVGLLSIPLLQHLQRVLADSSPITNDALDELWNALTNHVKGFAAGLHRDLFVHLSVKLFEKAMEKMQSMKRNTDAASKWLNLMMDWCVHCGSSMEKLKLDPAYTRLMVRWLDQ